MYKVVQRAIEAKEAGYLYMASVVKQVFRTTYYHVVRIDDVIQAGRWIPAQMVTFPSGARCKEGVTWANVDWSVTILK